eukprot:TRINITY_DN1160_c0_g1_i1.p1 TRINITY_DN1160_c0_g1~~TRINITY_DN1160_c0_g1_i1.p1  ORF type:complete len:662 (+),score=155.71 TRINITY_DN1160_c0_g1_i1:83-1987(+)
MLARPKKELAAEMRALKLSTTDKRELAKHADILEAWTGRMDREMEDGEYEIVSELAMMGIDLLALFISESALHDTNVLESFTKWITNINGDNTKDRYVVAMTNLISVFTDLLEDTEIANLAFPLVHKSFMKLLTKKVPNYRNTILRRNVADALLVACNKSASNKQLLDAQGLVALFLGTADPALKETLVHIIRRGVINNKAATREAEANKSRALKTLCARLGDDLFHKFKQTGKSEQGAMEVILAHNKVSPHFKLLVCKSWTVHGSDYNAKDYEGLPNTKKLLVYANKDFISYQMPTDDHGWHGVSYDMIDKLSHDNTKRVVRIELETNDVLLFTTCGGDKDTVRDWLTYVEDGMNKDDTDIGIEEASSLVLVPTKPIALPNPTPPPSVGNKRKSDLLFDLDGMSPSPKKASGTKRTKRSIISPSVEHDRKNAIGGKWEAPDSLLLGKSWFAEDQSSDEEDAEFEMQQMERALTQTLEKREEQSLNEMHELQREVQQLVDHVKKTEIVEKRQELLEKLKHMERDIRRGEETFLSDIGHKEKALTKDVTAFHKKFRQDVKVANGQLRDLLTDLDNIMPNSKEYNEMFDASAQTIVKKGSDYLQKKLKKKQNKTDAVMKMFSMITQGFSQGNRARI